MTTPTRSTAPAAPVTLARDGAVAILSFNRPEALNALDTASAQAFAAACRAISADVAAGEVRAVADLTGDVDMRAFRIELRRVALDRAAYKAVADEVQSNGFIFGICARDRIHHCVQSFLRMVTTDADQNARVLL